MQKICQCVRNFLETTKICAVYLLNILDFFSRLCQWKPLSAVLLQLNEVAFSTKYFFPKINIWIRTRKKTVSLKKKRFWNVKLFSFEIFFETSQSIRKAKKNIVRIHLQYQPWNNRNFLNIYLKDKGWTRVCHFRLDLFGLGLFLFPFVFALDQGESNFKHKNLKSVNLSRTAWNIVS